MTHKKRSSVTPVQLIALGFLIMMLLGTGLLLLPISQRHPGSLSIVDAAFTAVSAVSTTGLTVVDTASTFSTFGYVVLCILIQIGGLGITSIGAGLIAFTGRKLRMRDQVLVQEALNYPTMWDGFYFADSLMFFRRWELRFFTAFPRLIMRDLIF